MTKKADKTRISKEKTLAACWEKLDAEYGDVVTLATECMLHSVIRFELVAKRGSLALTEPNRESETTRRKKVSYFDEGLNIIITHINK